MHLPDPNRSILLKPRVVETDMNAGTKGWIKKAHTVGRQEQDTLEVEMLDRQPLTIVYLTATYTVVLKRSQKHRHNRIALDVRLVALLEKDVGFI